MRMMELLPQDSTYLQGLTRKLAPPLGKIIFCNVNVFYYFYFSDIVVN